VVLGLRVVHEAASRAGLDAELSMRLEHIHVSHHGELEWGSPKRPSTIEALLLHHVDNLDAKAAAFEHLCASAVRSDESWTDAGNLFRRPLFAPCPLDDDRSEQAGATQGGMRMSA
jgi:3'-5' exoribonuclease